MIRNYDIKKYFHLREVLFYSNSEIHLSLTFFSVLSFIFIHSVICHNLALVQMFCDRVLVLYEGKVVESGIPDDIINEPKEEYTRRLVDAVLS